MTGILSLLVVYPSICGYVLCIGTQQMQLLRLWNETREDKRGFLYNLGRGLLTPAVLSV